MISRDRLVTDFLELVRIDSPSGDEDAIAEDLVRRLSELGAFAAQDAFGNVIATVPGNGEPLLLSAHMDTVEPGRGIVPVFDGDNIIRTDGSTVLGSDDKAGCAVILEVLRSLAEEGAAHRPIEIAITRGEEIGLVGATELDYSRLTARVAIVVDIGGPPSDIQSASPWGYWYTVEVHGRSAHAGLEPEKGIPAITIASEVVLGLPQGRLDHETTANVGKINGGQVVNAVPEFCRVEGEFRSMVFEKADTLLVKARAHVEDVRERYPDARIDIEFDEKLPGFNLEFGDPAYDLILGVLADLDMAPNPHPIGGGTDGNVFRGHGIASVVIGRGGYEQHTRDEYLVISEMVDCARVVDLACRKDAGEG